MDSSILKEKENNKSDHFWVGNKTLNCLLKSKYFSLLTLFSKILSNKYFVDIHTRIITMLNFQNIFKHFVYILEDWYKNHYKVKAKYFLRVPLYEWYFHRLSHAPSYNWTCSLTLDIVTRWENWLVCFAFYRKCCG